MKALHVIASLGQGGAERQLHLLATNAQRVRPEVAALRGDGPYGDLLRAAGVPVHLVDARAPSVGALLAVLAASRGRDVVHGWLYHGAVASVLLATRARARAIWSILQEYAPDLEKPATARFARVAAKCSGRTAAIVYNSARSAAQHEAAGFAAARRVVIPNGHDTGVFRPDRGARERLRKALRVPPGAVLVGTLGRSHPAKDHATYLRAASLVREQGIDVRFAMFGPGTDSETRGVHDVARDLGINGAVHFGGEVADAAATLAGLDVFVSSSRAEGLPNAVGEAMACGVPAVVTDTGDTAELVGDPACVVPVESPGALAAAIARLAAMPDAARAALGAAARERIIARFSVATMVRAYEDVQIAVSRRN